MAGTRIKHVVLGFVMMLVLLWFKQSLFQNFLPHSSDIRRTLVGNKIGDHSDLFGASSIGVAPTTYYRPNTWLQ